MLSSCLARTENKQSDKANRNTRENAVVVFVVAAVRKARVALHKVCYHCCYVNAHCMNRRKSSFCCLHFVEGEKLAKALERQGAIRNRCAFESAVWQRLYCNSMTYYRQQDALAQLSNMLILSLFLAIALVPVSDRTWNCDNTSSIKRYSLLTF